MKKILFLSLFISLKMFGQSVTIVPSNINNTEFLKIKKYGIGLDHRYTDGLVGVGTFAAPGSGYIQTHTPHSLHFSTNNDNAFVTLSYSATSTLNGNLGINNTTPQEKLHVVGNIRTSSLAGTGNRHVMADANGTLIAEPSAQTLILQPTDFHPLVWSSSLYRFETSVSFTTIGGLVAPIKLPVGAKINSITLRAKDNLNTGKILYSLEKMSTSTNIPSQLSTGSSTIAEANASAINYVFTNSLPVTIQANNYYYITVNVYNSVDQITIPWNSGTNFFLGWIEIQYTF